MIRVQAFRLCYTFRLKALETRIIINKMLLCMKVGKERKDKCTDTGS